MKAKDESEATRTEEGEAKNMTDPVIQSKQDNQNLGSRKSKMIQMHMLHDKIRTKTEQRRKEQAGHTDSAPWHYQISLPEFCTIEEVPTKYISKFGSKTSRWEKLTSLHKGQE